MLAPAGGARPPALAPLARRRASRRASRAVRRRTASSTLVLARGLELRLGDAGDLRLKLAVARRILLLERRRERPRRYVDVSVPERPVVGESTLKSKVKLEG